MRYLRNSAAAFSQGAWYCSSGKDVHDEKTGSRSPISRTLSITKTTRPPFHLASKQQDCHNAYPADGK